MSEPFQLGTMNTIRSLSVKLMTFIKTIFGFFKEGIKAIYLLGLLILVLLLFISHQQSEIKKQLKIVALIQKLVHSEQDSQIASLTSEQLDFALLNPREQFEQWNKMNSQEKSECAEIFYKTLYHSTSAQLGMTNDEQDKLIDQVEAIADKSPTK